MRIHGKKLLLFFRRTAAMLAAVMLAVCCLTACGKEEEAEEEEGYSGVLTKIKLGMPQNKVISLNKQKEMYYESDTCIWTVNPDTDLMEEVTAIIPEDSEYYYCQDSIITYNFRYDDKETQNFLTEYMEEIVCLIDKETAKTYYEDKVKKLAKKYSSEYLTTQTGTEGVDMQLFFKTELPLSSFTVTVNMTETFDTVDGVDDYYCTHMSITVKELANKSAVPVKSSADDDDKKDKDKDKEKEEKAE